MRGSLGRQLAALVVVVGLTTLAPRPGLALVDGELDFGEQTALLDGHNSHRSQTANGNTPAQPAAADMNKLLWDNGLAKVAQDWADQCVWLHNPDPEGDLDSQLTRFSFDPTQVTVGENLHATTATASVPVLLSGIEGWYDEHVDYDYSSQACSGVCGHYTAVVWATTRYVGCGWKLCPTLANTSLTNATYLVCNYQSAGNFAGQDPYQDGSACSQCDSDRLVCEAGQCGGCTAPDWDFCSDWYSNCGDFAAFCPGDCDLSSSEDLCTGCRATCGTCSAEMLQPEATCDDVPIPCSEGCNSFDACLDGDTAEQHSCDVASGFCAPQLVECHPDACIDGACVSAGPVPSVGPQGLVALGVGLATLGLFGLSRQKWRA